MPVQAPLTLRIHKGETQSAVEVQDGTRAIEVAAMFEESVVELRHFSDPQCGVVTPATKGALGGAVASLALAFVLFLVSYVQVGHMSAQKDAWERGNTPMAERSVPRDSAALDIVSTILLVFGVGGLLIGLARLFEERQPRDFTIGPDARALFNAPAELLPVPAFPLVRSTGTDYELLFAPEMSGDVEVRGTSTTLAALAQDGHARPSSAVPGAYAWAIPNDARIKVELGQNTFLVSSVAAPRRHAAGLAIDWQQQAYTGAVALVTALFLFMIFSIPPDPKSLSLDQFMSSNRFAKFDFKAVQEKELDIPDFLKKPIVDDAAGSKGGAHKGPSGKMGSKSAPVANKSYAIKGPPTTKDVRLAKETAEQAAKNAGILGLMKPGAQVASIFGESSAIGRDALNAMGNLQGLEPGEARGEGGLGVFGKEKGGGGDNERSIGVGRLATVGHGGGGDKDGNSYGKGRGLFHGHKVAALELDPKGEAHVKGALDKEIIRRVVRHHLNEVKFCYEEQLARQQDLFGRVVVQFTISGTGGVVAAVVQSSSLKSPTVDQCVANAVRRWSFPKPEGGGIVMVSYPFSFKAAGE